MSDDSLQSESLNISTALHNSSSLLRKHIHVVLVQPETGGNIGSTARALANMGLQGHFFIVGTPDRVDNDARKLARAAKQRLMDIEFFPNLEAALSRFPRRLALASTARVGSAHRPHPVWARDAIPKAVEQLQAGRCEDLVFVFGPEGSGLTNEDIALCDWVVTIPSNEEYRSLNLAQAVMVFAYEFQMSVLSPWREYESVSKSQREKLVEHFIQLAEEVGFILPGDPFKMKPRLTEILSQLPRHIDGVKTLHGFLSQAIRSVKKGEVSFKGRYRNRVEENGNEHGRT